MYLTKVELRNIRSIREISWEIDPMKGPGWHVVLGDNGSGKSTLLRAIALGLIGHADAAGLRQDWTEWLTQDAQSGSIDLEISRHEDVDFSRLLDSPPYGYDTLDLSGLSLDPQILTAGIEMTRDSSGIKLSPRIAEDEARRHCQGAGCGWFAVSYGPFRRFTGGDRQYEKLFYSEPKLARHLSVFGEDVALTEALEWVKKLQFKKLERHPEGALLDPLITFINQPDFLPHGARLQRVSSEGVFFFDGNDREISLLEMSDGYRSILSMTFELIRQLAMCYEPSNVFRTDSPGVIQWPGVVLIDEIDVHLHPTWQRRVGLWFRKHFPNLQFIVTTHSPLICQAADVGTVFRLPSPGSDEHGRMLDGEELDRLLYGNVLDAYSTGAFGDGVSRSRMGKDRLKRLAELNLKALKSDLSQPEMQERTELQAGTPTAASTVQIEATAAQ